MFKRLLFGVLAIMVVSSAAYAVTLEQAQLDEVLSSDSIAYIDNNTSTSTAMLITYSGTSPSTGALAIESSIVGASTWTVKEGSNIVGKFLTSNTSSDTVGEMVANIDGLSNWSCSIDNSDLLYSDDVDLVEVRANSNDTMWALSITTGGVTNTSPYQINKRIAATDSDEVIRLGDVVAVPATAGDDVEIYEEDSSGNVTKLLDKDIQETSSTIVYGDNVIPLGSLLGGFDVTKGSDIIIKINGSAVQATDGTDYLYFPYQREDRTY